MTVFRSASTIFAHCILLATLCLVSTLVHSQPKPPEAAASAPQRTIKNDRKNYEGDRLHPRFPGTFKLATFEDGVLNLGGATCITKGAKLQGKGDQQVGGVSYHLFEVDSNPGETRNCPPTGSPAATATKGQMLAISAETLEAFPFNREGLAYGTLVVPFEYHVKGDKSFSNESSLGGYFGYRWDTTASSGSSFQLGIFAGATSIKLTQDVNGKPTEQSLTGLSYGLAFLAEFKRDFQIGFVVGADKLGKNASYVNNDKPWIAFSIGFDFAR